MERVDLPIVRRRVAIACTSARARHWSRGDGAIEQVLNALSFVFPAGEAYFVDSVRTYLKEIDDPILKDQAESFIFQETMHAREHNRSNALLKEAHPHGAKVERMISAILRVSRYLPRPTRLAASCAYEHFTAMFADCLLRTQHTFAASCDPAFAALWLWHAAEETEHKAVCFDVYRRVVGDDTVAYLHRIAIMFFVSLGFSAGLAAGFVIMGWNRRGRRPRGAAARMPADRGAAFGLGFLVRRVSWRLYFNYYRPSFHPWDHQNAHLVAEWRRNFEAVTLGRAGIAPLPADAGAMPAAS